MELRVEHTWPVPVTVTHQELPGERPASLNVTLKRTGRNSPSVATGCPWTLTVQSRPAGPGGVVYPGGATAWKSYVPFGSERVRNRWFVERGVGEPARRTPHRVPGFSPASASVTW